ncbi:MAG: HlyD family efflux transporter periplasmic adaptor subunit [Patescibacteria group bacterium]
MKKVIKSKIFWAIIIILLVVGGLAFQFLGKGKEVKYDTQLVKLGDVAQTVTATGQVKSASEIELNFKNSGQISAINVKVGDAVKAGQILATQKAAALQINITKYSNELARAKANLAKVKTGATKEDIAVYQAALERSQADLASAQTNLENTKSTYQQALDNGKQNIIIDVSNSISKANISLQRINDTLNYKGSSSNLITYNSTLRDQVNNEYTIATSRVGQALTAYNAIGTSNDDAKIDSAVDLILATLIQVDAAVNDLGQLLNYAVVNSTLTQAELDALKTAVNTDRATADSNVSAMQDSKHDLEVARLNYQTEVADAQDAVRTAEKNLAKAEADLQFKTAPARPEDITLYEAAARNAQADLELAIDNYNDTIIKAPIDGVITEVNYEVGEQAGFSQTVSGNAVIKMLANQNYEIEVNIPESDIAKLNLGDSVDITLDAFSQDDIFAGNVTVIEPAQTKIQDVVYYKVTVIFSGEQAENVKSLMAKIKPGMTANVTIKTAKVSNVLVIPLRAVKEQDGKKTVQILENSLPKTVEVQLGLKGDEGLVEVKTGLVQGQSVITYTPGAK